MGATLRYANKREKKTSPFVECAYASAYGGERQDLEDENGEGGARGDKKRAPWRGPPRSIPAAEEAPLLARREHASCRRLAATRALSVKRAFQFKGGSSVLFSGPPVGLKSSRVRPLENERKTGRRNRRRCRSGISSNLFKLTDRYRRSFWFHSDKNWRCSRLLLVVVLLSLWWRRCSRWRRRRKRARARSPSRGRRRARRPRRRSRRARRLSWLGRRCCCIRGRPLCCPEPGARQPPSGPRSPG